MENAEEVVRIRKPRVVKEEVREIGPRRSIAGIGQDIQAIQTQLWYEAAQKAMQERVPAPPSKADPFGTGGRRQLELEELIDCNLLAQKRCRDIGRSVPEMVLEDHRRLTAKYRLLLKEQAAEEEVARVKRRAKPTAADIRKAAAELDKARYEEDPYKLPDMADAAERGLPVEVNVPSMVKRNLAAARKDVVDMIMSQHKFFKPTKPVVKKGGQQLELEQRECQEEAQADLLNSLEWCNRWRMKKSGTGYDIWVEGGPHFLHVSNRAMATAIFAFFTGDLTEMLAERREVNGSLPRVP